MANDGPQKLAKALATVRPLERPTLPTDINPESRLTPGQLTGLNYSREKYANGSYAVDAPHSQYNPGNEPAVTSFYGAVDQTPQGDFINYPTFWDGKVIDRKEALRRAFDYEEQTGKKFARYPTVNSAEWNEMQVVHPIMDSDAQRVLQTPEAKKRLKAAK